MLSVILVQDSVARDAFVSALSLEKQSHDSGVYSVYKRGKWVLVFDTEKNLEQAIIWAVENYNPEQLYLPYFGKVVDIVREIGDVVLPNVLLSYNPKIALTEITRENRDSFTHDAKFLEIYDEQKDYYVEDFGLSIGGIVVDNVPDDINPEKLMLAYEADVYVSASLSEAHALIRSADASIILALGVVEGKHPKNRTLVPIDHTVRNMITTFRLLEGE